MDADRMDMPEPGTRAGAAEREQALGAAGAAEPRRADPPGRAPSTGGPHLEDYRPGDEAEIVRVLDACQGGGWGDVELWRWKHGGRPGFEPGEVVTARSAGAMVACFHGAVLPIKLEEGLEVPMSFDGDFAVVPGFRKRGVPLAAHDRTDRRLLARRVALRGGFTSAELNRRFYHRQFGYVFVPSMAAQYRKMLGPGPLMPRVAALGESILRRRRCRRALRRRPLVIDLRIASFPACHLVLAGDGFRLERGAATHPHLVVGAPYAVLVALADGAPALLRAACSQCVRGRVRVGGLVRAAPRLAGIALSLVLGR